MIIFAHGSNFLRTVLLWKNFRWIFWTTFIVGVFTACFVLYMAFAAPPSTFPVDDVIEIEEGQSLTTIAERLKERGVITSPFTFRALVIVRNQERGVQAGLYSFDEPLNVYNVAWRLTAGVHNMDSYRVTVREGLSVFEIAAVIEDKIENFDPAVFLAEAREEEGYLFPDTYFFVPGTDEDDMIKTMRDTFDEKIAPFEEQVADSGNTLHEIITMASIIEKEAYNSDERRMISGILWKRIDEGMRLQVDATFNYVNGKNTFELTTADLVSTSSPYNTYAFDGLPPGPIANPGLDSIEAALEPEESPYYYYLHGLDGEIRYAETLEGHRQNRRLYLGK